MRLGSTRSQVTWVNIWQDSDAAAYVASHNDGNETVPTAVTGDGELLERDADVIKAHLVEVAGGTDL